MDLAGATALRNKGGAGKVQHPGGMRVNLSEAVTFWMDLAGVASWPKPLPEAPGSAESCSAPYTVKRKYIQFVHKWLLFFKGFFGKVNVESNPS